VKEEAIMRWETGAILERAGWVGLWLLVAVLSLAGARGMSAQPKPVPRPTKFEVEAAQKVVPPGASVDVRIKLTDADNELRPPRVEIPAEMTVKTAGGASRKVSVIFKPGESTKLVPIVIDQSGIADIKVTNPEFLEGGTAVKVKPAKPSGWRLAPSRDGLPRFFVFRGLDGVLPRWPGAVLVTHHQTGHYTVELRVNPDREILANGKDAATIEMWLDEEDTQETDIRFWLHHSDGDLTANPILMPAGTEFSSARLVATEPAEIRVALMNAQPAAVPIKGIREVLARFVPAVSRLSVVLSPASVTLFDQATIDLTLQDTAGTPIATHRDRPISLRLGEGRGVLSARDVVIKAQAFNQHVMLQPAVTGAITVVAESPNLRTEESNRIGATFPAAGLILTLAGGLLGGAASYWNEKVGRPSRRWVLSLLLRTGIGAIAGLLLYYLALEGLAPNVSLRLLGTILGQFAVGLVGGWGGPSIFDLANTVLLGKNYKDQA
jgi:hypothetical protein